MRQEAAELELTLEQNDEFMRGRTDTFVDMATGKIHIPTSREKLRTGGAAITGPIWERIATYSDISIKVFPNLKYMDSTEMSPLDKVINDGVDKFKAQATTELTPEQIFTEKKKLARAAAAFAEHPWKDKDDEEFVVHKNASERRKANKAKQKQKKAELKKNRNY
jgi:hypothetical protein